MTAQFPPRLGNSASRDVGTTAGTVAAGDDSRWPTELSRAEAAETDLQAQISAFGAAIAPATPGSVLMVNDAGTDWVQTVLFSRGTNAAMPVAGVAGRIYGTTDNPRGLWQDTGTLWVPLAPLLCIKLSDTTVTNSTTLVADADLRFPIAAGAVVFAKAYLIVNADNDAMDFKFNWSLPGVATQHSGGGSGTGTSAWGVVATGVSAPALNTTTTQSVGTHTGGGEQGVSIAAIIDNTAGGATAGNIVIQYAQATLDAGSLTVKAKSTLQVWAY